MDPANISCSCRTNQLNEEISRRFRNYVEEKLAGGREVSRDVDLATMPLYARAGAIIPLGPVKQFTSEKADDPLVVQIYPGADGSFALYEDDGGSFNFRKGEWMELRMFWDDRRKRLTLRLADGSRMLPPSPRKIEIRIVPQATKRVVTFAGRSVQVQF